jgi:hypothetical protein
VNTRAKKNAFIFLVDAYLYLQYIPEPVLPGYRRSVFPWSRDKGRVEGMTILLNLTDTKLATNKVILIWYLVYEFVYSGVPQILAFSKTPLSGNR